METQRDWIRTYREIEDLLFSKYKLDVWERCLYYYLLRHTRLHGTESATIPLSQIASSGGISEFKAREAIRSLHNKGCIEIEQTRKGHQVKVMLPDELNLFAEAKENEPIDIEEIDFFKDRIYLESLITREQGKCFYCLKEVSKDACELDHVVSQMNRG